MCGGFRSVWFSHASTSLKANPFNLKIDMHSVSSLLGPVGPCVVSQRHNASMNVGTWPNCPVRSAAVAQSQQAKWHGLGLGMIPGVIVCARMCGLWPVLGTL